MLSNKHYFKASAILSMILLFSLGSVQVASAFSGCPPNPAIYGEIYAPATPATNPMDPNGDGMATNCVPPSTPVSQPCPLLSNETNDELGWVTIPQPMEEPNNDLKTGAGCGQSDIMDNPIDSNDASHVLFRDPDGILGNGDEVFMFRLRIATDPVGAFGYSVAFDTDGKFGYSGPNYDVNARKGNPGFEYEIRLASGGNDGVYVDDVNGKVVGTNLSSFPLTTHSQKSYAVYTQTACSGSGCPIFYDFYIPFSDLPFGINTPIRVVSATVSSPSSILGGSASDIGGVDDDSNLFDLAPDDTMNRQDSMFIFLINQYNPSPPSELTDEGCFTDGQTDLPTIDPISTGDNTITGTMTQFDSTKIILFRNDAIVDSAWFNASTWSFSVSPTLLREGDQIKVLADAACKLPSDTTADSRVSGGCILINEIKINAEGTCDDACNPATAEWYELYNQCSYEIDISCYRLCDGDFCVTIPSGTYLKANDFFTIGSGNSPDGTVDLNISTCGCVDGSGQGALDNSAEQLALFDIDGNFEDGVIWGGGQSLPATPTAGALGGCNSLPVTLPAASDPNWENIGGDGGTDSCVYARLVDASLTWQLRCRSNITFDSTNNSVFNKRPIAVDDVATTDEDVLIFIDVQNNDSDPDNDPITTVSIFQQPSNGTASIFFNDSIRYIPAANFTGMDTLIYVICDTGFAQLCDTAQVVITVNPINDPPIAVDDATYVDGGFTARIFVQSNDTESDGDVMTTSIVAGPSNGSVNILNGDSIDYTPTGAFTGVDQFTYRVCDPFGLCDTATVTINVGIQCIYINEILVDGAGACDGACNPSTQEWVELYNTCCGSINVGCYVIGTPRWRATIPAGTTIPEGGYLTIGSNNSPNGTPNINLSTCACWTGSNIGEYPNSKYEVGLFSNNAVLQDALIWGGGQHVPSTDASLALGSCGSKNVTLPSSNNPAYENIGVTSTAGCVKARSTDAGSTWVERCGSAITFGATNGTANNAPVPANDNATLSGSFVNINVLANDVEPDGDGLVTTAIVIPPVNGTATILANQQIRYTPYAGSTCDDTLQYRVCDDFCPELCATAYVYINSNSCFTAVSSGDWNNPLTWACNKAPGCSDCVIIPATVTVNLTVSTCATDLTVNGTLNLGNYRLNVSGDVGGTGSVLASDAGTGGLFLNGTSTQTVSGSLLIDNLVVDNTTQVVLAPGATLIITDNLVARNGDFDITGGTLTLASTGTQTARIDGNTGGTITGDVTSQRYINTCYGWTGIASNVTPTTLSDWADDVYIQGITGANSPTADPNLVIYDETFLGTTDSLYVGPSDITDQIQLGLGYLLWIYDGTLPVQLQLEGAPVRTTINFPVTYTSSGSVYDDGWNLLGNPFPSAIDWYASGWTKVGCCDAIYTFDACSNQYTEFVGGVENNGGSRYVASGQAFFMKVHQASIDLSATPFVCVDTNRAFKEKIELHETLKVIATNDSSYTDEISVRFVDGASAYMDSAFDAVKFFSPNWWLVPSLYTLDANQLYYGTNGQPELISDKTIPLAIYNYDPGSITLLASEIGPFSNSTTIYLEDLWTGDWVKFRNNDTYTFYWDPNIHPQERFLLHFTSPIELTTTNPTCNGASDGIVTMYKHTAKFWDIEWTDSLGNPVKPMVNKTGARDTITGLAAGTYTVKMTDTSGATISETFEIGEPSVLQSSATITNEQCNDSEDGTIALTVTGGTSPFTFSWSNGESTDIITGLAAGQYAVDITDAKGCMSNATYEVFKNEAVVASFTKDKDTTLLSDGGGIQFTNLGSGAAYYIWDFGDGSPLFSKFNPYHEYQYTGTYDVMNVAVYGACRDTFTSVVHVIQGITGIDGQLGGQGSIQAYIQNGNQLYIKLNFMEGTNAQINLHNILGQSVVAPIQKEQMRKDLIHLDLSNLPDAVYLLSVSTDNGEEMFSQKIMVNKP